MDEAKCTGYIFDRFEVLLDSETLRKNGHNVRIQQLPFQTLVLLLENAGRVVSRDELHRRLWNHQTFIEFDNNLRVAVTKLRGALGEQAAEPRFIRTVARKGYQFVGEVVPVFPVAAAHSTAQALVSGASSGETWPSAQSARSLLRRPSAAMLAALVALVGLAAVSAVLYLQRPLVSDKDTVALGGVSNESNDPVFDGVLTTAFRLKMQESPYLSPLPELDFRRVVGREDDTAPLPKQLSACKSLGASVLLQGHLKGGRSGYKLALQVLRCSDGRLMATESATAVSQADVLTALTQTTEKIRHRLGESTSSLQKYNAPLTQATTSSLVALQAFMLGAQRHAQGQEAQSISNYRLAVDLDPQFAMAYAQLGTAYLNTGQYSAAKSAYEMAYNLRERTTDRERLYIAAHYYAAVTGEVPREIEVYQLWRTIYPRDVLPVDNLVNIYLSLGIADKALQMASLAVELAPRSPPTYALLARAYLSSGRYRELNQLCTDPQRSKTDMVLFHSACYLSTFVQGDAPGQQRELDWAQGKPQESFVLQYQAWTQVYRGRLAEARRTFSNARQSASKQNLTDFVAELDLDEAGLDADLGQRTEAIHLTHAAVVSIPGSRFVHAFAALVLARAGEDEDARSEAVRATSLAPLDSIQRDTLLASAQASILLGMHDPKAAIRALDDVRPFDNIGFMALSPAYYRGLALAQDRQYAAAARSFQQVIDHRVLYPQSVYIVLSQLQLGRTLQLAGRPAEAEVQYDAVRRVWQQADANFQPLLQLNRWARSLGGG